MAYADLAARLRPGFDLPVGGRTFHVPEPKAKDGLWLQALMDGAASFALTAAVGAANKAVLSDEEERTVYQVALGPAYDEMLAADVPWPLFKHAGMTAWVHWTRGADAGERYWSAFDRAGRGKAETAEETSAAG